MSVLTAEQIARFKDGLLMAYPGVHDLLDTIADLQQRLAASQDREKAQIAASLAKRDAEIGAALAQCRRERGSDFVGAFASEYLPFAKAALHAQIASAKAMGRLEEAKYLLELYESKVFVYETLVERIADLEKQQALLYQKEP